MRPRRHLPLAAAFACLLLGPMVGGRAGRAAAPARPPTAAALYDRSLRADDHFSYRGRQVTTYWRSGYTVATLVSHRAPSLDRLDYLAPESQVGRKFLSDGRQEWRYYPHRRVEFHHPLDPSADAVADAAAAYVLLRTNYFITVSPRTQTWAGRKAYLLTITRRADHSLARKLWVDAATGLELKRESYRETGRLAATTAFSTITFHPEQPRAQFDPARLPGRVRVVEEPRDRETPVPTAAVGHRLGGAWLTPLALSGYRLVGAALAGGPRPRLHLRYSDGLNLVSLFEQRRIQTRQPTRVPRSRPVQIGPLAAHVVRRAALTALNWDTPAFNLTLMGEVSQETLQRLALTVGDRRP